MNKDTEMYHAAINILSNRADQLGLDDDELMHYGRKGMKWNETIFTDEDRARGQAVREAQRKQRETDAIRAQGQAVREAQRKQRETDELRKTGQDVRYQQKLERMRQEVAERQRLDELNNTYTKGKANAYLEKAHREGNGQHEVVNPVSSRPDTATYQDIGRYHYNEEQRKNNLTDKKNELLSKAYAEKEARDQGARNKEVRESIDRHAREKAEYDRKSSMAPTPEGMFPVYNGEKLVAYADENGGYIDPQDNPVIPHIEGTQTVTDKYGRPQGFLDEHGGYTDLNDVLGGAGPEGTQPVRDAYGRITGYMDENGMYADLNTIMDNRIKKNMAEQQKLANSKKRR